MTRPYGARPRAGLAVARLKETYEPICELDFASPYQLLIATILSAQSTDRTVNAVTPLLFHRWSTPADLAAADPAEVEALIKPTGFFREKTRAIMGSAAALVERFGGQVPASMVGLTDLPGVGRKTANVVLGVGFGLPGFAVDTHVKRLCHRLGLTSSADPVEIETDVTAIVPREEWTDFSLRLILHGRRVCHARRPQCEGCPLTDFCPASLLRSPNKRSKIGGDAGQPALDTKRRASKSRR